MTVVRGDTGITKRTFGVLPATVPYVFSVPSVVARISALAIFTLPKAFCPVAVMEQSSHLFDCPRELLFQSTNALGFT